MTRSCSAGDMSVPLGQAESGVEEQIRHPGDDGWRFPVERLAVHRLPSRPSFDVRPRQAPRTSSRVAPAAVGSMVRQVSQWFGSPHGAWGWNKTP